MGSSPTGVERRFDLDVRDKQRLERALRSAEVIYHLAARISVTESQQNVLFDVNVRGVGNLARAALRAGVRRLIHFGSIQAYRQEPLAAPLDERRPLVDNGRYLGRNADREMVSTSGRIPR